jgi:hypothetical protein
LFREVALLCDFCLYPLIFNIGIKPGRYELEIQKEEKKNSESTMEIKWHYDMGETTNPNGIEPE